MQTAIEADHVLTVVIHNDIRRITSPQLEVVRADVVRVRSARDADLAGNDGTSRFDVAASVTIAIIDATVDRVVAAQVFLCAFTAVVNIPVVGVNAMARGLGADLASVRACDRLAAHASSGDALVLKAQRGGGTTNSGAIQTGRATVGLVGARATAAGDCADCSFSSRCGTAGGVVGAIGGGVAGVACRGHRLQNRRARWRHAATIALEFVAPVRDRRAAESSRVGQVRGAGDTDARRRAGRVHCTRITGRANVARVRDIRTEAGGASHVRARGSCAERTIGDRRARNATAGWDGGSLNTSIDAHDTLAGTGRAREAVIANATHNAKTVSITRTKIACVVTSRARGTDANRDRAAVVGAVGGVARRVDTDRVAVGIGKAVVANIADRGTISCRGARLFGDKVDAEVALWAPTTTLDLVATATGGGVRTFHRVEAIEAEDHRLERVEVGRRKDRSAKQADWAGTLRGVRVRSRVGTNAWCARVAVKRVGGVARVVKTRVYVRDSGVRGLCVGARDNVDRSRATGQGVKEDVGRDRGQRESPTVEQFGTVVELKNRIVGRDTQGAVGGRLARERHRETCLREREGARITTRAEQCAQHVQAERVRRRGRGRREVGHVQAGPRGDVDVITIEVVDNVCCVGLVCCSRARIADLGRGRGQERVVAVEEAERVTIGRTGVVSKNGDGLRGDVLPARDNEAEVDRSVGVDLATESAQGLQDLVA